MKETIFELISVGFLGLGFLFYEKPILSMLFFFIFAAMGCLCVSLEDEKERRMFRK